MISTFSHLLATLQVLVGTRRDERGASAVEYALLVGGIALVLGAAVALFGEELTGAFTDLIPD